MIQNFWICKIFIFILSHMSTRWPSWVKPIRPFWNPIYKRQLDLLGAHVHTTKEEEDLNLMKEKRKLIQKREKTKSKQEEYSLIDQIFDSTVRMCGGLIFCKRGKKVWGSCRPISAPFLHIQISKHWQILNGLTIIDFDFGGDLEGWTWYLSGSLVLVLILDISHFDHIL